jgi:hypothetical protein
MVIALLLVKYCFQAQMRSPERAATKAKNILSNRELTVSLRIALIKLQVQASPFDLHPIGI